MPRERKKKRKFVCVGKKKAIKIGEVIGEGGQSKIYKGRFDDKDVAVKSTSNEGDIKEVEILRKLDHPNVIKTFFTDTINTPPMTFMVLELCNYTLKEYVEDPGIGILLKPLEVLKQITEGLHYLHNGQTFRTVHRELKPSNILFQYVDREKLWRVKISDFGISKEIYGDKTSTSSSLRGSKGYTAPELLHDIKGKIRKETDMFSLGVIFYYTLSNGKHPFSNDPFEWELKIRDCEPCLDDLESEYAANVESLILSLLRKNYHERPSVSAVKSHHIFWESVKKLDFLHKASDYMEDRVKHHALIHKLEEFRQDVTSGKKWKDVICSETHNQEIKRVIEKDKRCESKISLQDLLRKIRNWASHYYDATTTEKFRTELGEYPYGFVNFFTSHFPKLLPCVYRIMMTQKNEDIFKLFYVTGYGSEFLHANKQPPSQRPHIHALGGLDMPPSTQLPISNKNKFAPTPQSQESSSQLRVHRHSNHQSHAASPAFSDASDKSDSQLFNRGRFVDVRSKDHSNAPSYSSHSLPGSRSLTPVSQVPRHQPTSGQYVSSNKDPGVLTNLQLITYPNHCKPPSNKESGSPPLERRLSVEGAQDHNKQGPMMSQRTAAYPTYEQYRIYPGPDMASHHMSDPQFQQHYENVIQQGMERDRIINEEQKHSTRMRSTPSPNPLQHYKDVIQQVMVRDRIINEEQKHSTRMRSTPSPNPLSKPVQAKSPPRHDERRPESPNRGQQLFSQTNVQFQHGYRTAHGSQQHSSGHQPPAPQVWPDRIL